MNVSETAGSLFFITLGAFAAWQAEKLSLGTVNVPGPGFFPFYLALLLIAVALIILIQGLRYKKEAAEPGLRWERVVLALAAIFIYAFALEAAGYLLSTFFLTLLLLQLMVRKKWWFAPALASIITLGSYMLFKVWLQVLLPRGFLGF